MARNMPQEPEVSVRQQVTVDLRADIVEHAVRFYLDQVIAPNRAPRAKNLADTSVTISVSEDGALLGARLVYVPEPTPPEAEQDGGR